MRCVTGPLGATERGLPGCDCSHTFGGPRPVICARVSQWTEQRLATAKVRGPSPRAGTTSFSTLILIVKLLAAGGRLGSKSPARAPKGYGIEFHRVSPAAASVGRSHRRGIPPGATNSGCSARAGPINTSDGDGENPVNTLPAFPAHSRRTLPR